MSVFDPECSGNRFSAEFKLTGDAGSPYEFGIRFSVDGDYSRLVACRWVTWCVSTASSPGLSGRRSMHGLYKCVLTFCAVFVGLVFAVMGFWALLGVTCLCAGMVLADVPERIGGRFGHEQ